MKITKLIFLFCLLQPFSSFSDEFKNNFKRSIQLVRAHQFGEALDILYNLEAQRPDNPAVLNNIAYTLKQIGRMAEAIPYYEKTMELAPGNDPRLGLAKAYLATGQFEKAWPLFEYRVADQENYRQKFQFQHLTLENLKDKTVLIVCEWGLGDMIQFAPRYAQVLKQAGVKKIIMHTFNPLVQLFQHCDYIDEVISLKQPAIGYFDVKIPALSLPLICKTQVETIPSNIPYLYADPDLVEYWDKELHKIEHLKPCPEPREARVERIRVGLCWQAKPGIFLEENPLTKRAVPLELFAPLAQLEHVQLYSLQRQFGMEQLYENRNKTCPAKPDWRRRIHDFGKNFDADHGRFMDTAAVIENLDLVISVDTAMVHVAGALGAPVWVLIPSVAEWRWHLHETETPWYPNVRLFRQKTHGDWASVIAQIVDELCKL